MSPPKIHASRISPPPAPLLAMNPVVVNAPVPIMLAMTVTVAAVSVRTRLSVIRLLKEGVRACSFWREDTSEYRLWKGSQYLCASQLRCLPPVVPPLFSGYLSLDADDSL